MEIKEVVLGLGDVGLGLRVLGLEVHQVVLGSFVRLVDMDAFVDEHDVTCIIIFAFNLALLALIWTWGRLSNLVLTLTICDFSFIFHMLEFRQELS